jgi:FKBP-type peptidyl-prolyl cis-trans isomerase
MASKRLQKVREDFPVGYDFDSNDNFEIDDNKRLIRGMRLAVDALLNMNRRHDGDVAAVMSASLVCRSDFAYGSEGYRKSNGDVVVPPFATLRFNIDVLS